MSFTFTASDIYKSSIHSSISISVSFCNSYSQRESFPLNCRSIVSFQKYKYPRYPSSVGRLVSFYYFYLQKALSRLKCRSSPVQISKSPAFSSSVSLLVSFCFLFPRTASFILNYRSCLPVQISKKPGYSSSESFLVSFCCFYSVKVLFPLNCHSSLSVHLSRNLGYWNCNRLQVRFCYFYSQRASFTINCSSSLPIQILYRRSRHSRAVLTFW